LRESDDNLPKADFNKKRKKNNRQPAVYRM
jgi:hypothetical protein